MINAVVLHQNIFFSFIPCVLIVNLQVNVDKLSTIEFPTHISKSYMNSSKRRKDGKGKQTWRIYGYDLHGHFKTERIKGTILGLKPTGIKLYHKKTGACINCGKHCIVATEKKDTPINCGKCKLESP